MPSPIDAMIGRADMRCTKCGAKAGTCDCWEWCSCGWTAERGKPCRNPKTTQCSTKIKHADQIVTLECPDCGSRKTTEREPSDLPGTVLVKARCPDCNDGGGFPDILYFDAAGRQITE